ncbi:MFS general substrate transporter [Gonapodya prolifera JEL478]|uniref:MFS general substrate transporter n=1 Tax=Gonapodya prolifera (strain JEL478) TaxID=1344416 RepID=A0A139A500_GONPJ|nr:MFS general substrate transporter [Gonapodya prolifera JEL478]|eukprot:KXS11814.1 MFS general substrate transporter [Gonapodya prolifera JEL478]
MAVGNGKDAGSAPHSKDTPLKPTPTPQSHPFVTRTLRTVFVALLIDILSFTIILPLLPRLLDHYIKTERVGGQEPTHTLLTTFLHPIRTSLSSLASTDPSLRSNPRIDVVLLGGVVGSLFSALQCVVAPWIGWASDRWGRKRVLMVAMTGNLISTLLWVFARSFPVFILSRTIGGLSEGNVQLSLAMIADVTSEEERSRGMALVGLAFSLGFTLGPPLGAYFANLRLPTWISDRYPIYPFSGAALLASGLIVVECLYLSRLEETKGFKERIVAAAAGGKGAEGKGAEANGNGTANGKDLPKPTKRRTKQERAKYLWTMSLLHWTYLLVFSGMEFTVPFLTFDRFSYTHTSQGLLFSFIGLLSSLVQGGYVRRHARRVGERRVIIQGLGACCLGLGILSRAYTTSVLYAGAACLAFASGTVVNVMNSVASGRDGKEKGKEDRGAVLGKFRSAGQLGRALGPLLACGLYWSVGAEAAYGFAALGMAGVLGAGWAFIEE